MKATLVTAAAAVMVGGVSAAGHHHHAHELFHARRAANGTDAYLPSCTTIYTTITGEFFWTPTPGPLTTTTTSTTIAPPVVVVTPSPVVVTSSAAPPPPPAPTTSAVTTPAVVPTPVAQTCPTPGTYTFPATTLVLTETTTVCGASTTTVPSGTHTLGGVTTVVETATTVVCPYATVKTSGTVVTSGIETTTYICPSAGTYTIGALTTTVTVPETVVPVPVVTSYAPGTYTAPAVVTTVTETDYVVYCPFESSSSPAPAPPATTEAPKPVTTEAPKPTTTEAAPAATTTSAKPAQSPSTGGLGTTGDKWAVTYTPYTTDTGACKSASDVLSDIAKIADAGFTAVRVYSTDCDTLPNVGAACQAHNLKMILGIFIGEVGCDNGNPDVATQISEIKSWAKFDLVDLIVVGNEALFNQYCTTSELAGLINHARSEFSSAGYTGPITTTDVVSAWQDNDVTDICSAVDVVACNAHAFFNADTTAKEAGPFVAGQLKIVEDICGKSGIVTETGWPHGGNPNGLAIPGASEQADAISSIQGAIGGKVCIFSWTSDEWKSDSSACGCEQKWGVDSIF